LKKSDDIALVLRELLMTCVEESADNMTAMIVQFTNGENYNKHGEFIPGPYLKAPRTSPQLGRKISPSMVSPKIKCCPKRSISRLKRYWSFYVSLFVQNGINEKIYF
jgi:hypothetical protein